MIQHLKFPGHVGILFVAANPKDEARLGLDEEIRQITQKVLATSQRDLLTFHQVWAARPYFSTRPCASSRLEEWLRLYPSHAKSSH
ncbi:MAG: hypothetical protein JO202_05405 [Ktedonobacteraceae bacterium]|nr:hypothetical protein [Ktedonobacteraceae bacterium]